MKRILFDHCVPRPLRRWLQPLDVHICAAHGWQTLENGNLLTAAENAGFEVFVTSDKRIRYQQNLARRRIAIVELPTNSFALLVPLVPALSEAIAKAEPGSFQMIPISDHGR